MKCAKVSGSFLNQVGVFLSLSFKSSSYILGNSPLSDVSFLNIFYCPMACLFTLLTMLLTEQKILTVVIPNSSILSVMNHAFSVVSKKLGANPSLLGCSVLVQFL